MKWAAVVTVLGVVLAAGAEAAEIKVLSTGGARAVMTSLVPEFERRTGHKVDIAFATPGGMRDRLGSGESADAVVAIAAILPDLEKAGRIAPGSALPTGSGSALNCARGSGSFPARGRTSPQRWRRGRRTSASPSSARFCRFRERRSAARCRPTSWRRP